MEAHPLERAPLVNIQNVGNVEELDIYNVIVE
jgi:hypothetical protein